MQLILLAVMLMALGKNANIKEIQPILESMGGEEVTDALRQAEELNSVISAVQSLANAAKPHPAEDAPTEKSAVMGSAADFGGNNVAPLAPVSRIADEEIAGCLARYLALGE